VIYLTLIAVHHLLGGFVLLYAYLYDNASLCGHAAMWELADDIHDLICLLFLYWPFEVRELKIIVFTGFHHIVGVIIIVPVLTQGLYLDQNLQLIAIALLLAGGVSCCAVIITRTMDRRVPKECWMDLLIWLVNLLFFLVCRFYIFPQQLYLYFEKTNWETNHLLIAGAMCMTMFNLLIFTDSLSSTYARMVIALNNGEKHTYNEKCRCERCQKLKVKSNGKVVDFTSQKKTN